MLAASLVRVVHQVAAAVATAAVTVAVCSASVSLV
jgi:hypothetical protein